MDRLTQSLILDGGSEASKEMTAKEREEAIKCINEAMDFLVITVNKKGEGKTTSSIHGMQSAMGFFMAIERWMDEMKKAIVKSIFLR